ncbi:hypothetical protein RIF29_28446 [Crotalaria pallida]|uniref:Uncharacterized protein n=1 Tax=Crotalaria pallida TaxID=3830 RepID=A0AAN9ECT9_CROPI
MYTGYFLFNILLVCKSVIAPKLFFIIGETMDNDSLDILEHMLDVIYVKVHSYVILIINFEFSIRSMRVGCGCWSNFSS